MTTEEVAKITGCKQITARKWALANGVKFIGSSNRKMYIWTDADLARFKARKKPGRPKESI